MTLPEECDLSLSGPYSSLCAGWPLELGEIHLRGTLQCRGSDFALNAVSQGLEAGWSSGMENRSDVLRIGEKSSGCSCLAPLLPLTLPKLVYASFSAEQVGEVWKSTTRFSQLIEKKSSHSCRKIIQAQLKCSKSTWHDFFLITTFEVYRTINKLHTQAARSKMKTE